MPKTALVAAALLAVAGYASAGTARLELVARNRADYDFESFKAEFGKSYASAEEHEHRKELFERAKVEINAHNAAYRAGVHSHFQGINKFADLLDHETPKGYAKGQGRKGDFPGVVGKPDEGKAPALKDEKDLPTAVDWRAEGVTTPPKDQGGCGSCWAFAATEAMESALALASGNLTELSPQQLVSCVPNPEHCGGSGGCHGATCELAFQHYVSVGGVVAASKLVYDGADERCTKAMETDPVATIESWVRLPENEYLPLLNAVATVGPVTISVDASDWGRYQGGIHTPSAEKQAHVDVNHAVVLEGYGEENGQKYWLVRNSWGSAWGEGGYIRLARQGQGEEQACGVDSTPCDGTGCTGQCDTVVTVCGMSGILYDTSYPVGASAL